MRENHHDSGNPWLGPVVPIPNSTREMLGVMNLRGTVIPIIDLACKLGMEGTVPNERSAIVVAEIHGMAVGLVVDQVSDILTVPFESLQPVPDMNAGAATDYSDGFIVQTTGMICFLNLDRMFEGLDAEPMIAA